MTKDKIEIKFENAKKRSEERGQEYLKSQRNLDDISAFLNWMHKENKRLIKPIDNNLNSLYFLLTNKK